MHLALLTVFVCEIAFHCNATGFTCETDLDVDYYSGDIVQYYDIPDAASCCNLCTLNPQCVVYTWSYMIIGMIPAKKCWLKSEIASDPSYYHGLISGRKIIDTTGSVHPDEDLHNFCTSLPQGYRKGSFYLPNSHKCLFMHVESSSSAYNWSALWDHCQTMISTSQPFIAHPYHLRNAKNVHDYNVARHLFQILMPLNKGNANTGLKTLVPSSTDLQAWVYCLNKECTSYKQDKRLADSVTFTDKLQLDLSGQPSLNMMAWRKTTDSPDGLYLLREFDDDRDAWVTCEFEYPIECPAMYSEKNVTNAIFLSNPERPVGTVAIMAFTTPDVNMVETVKITCKWNQSTGVAEWDRAENDCPIRLKNKVFRKKRLYARVAPASRIALATFYDVSSASVCAVKCFGEYKGKCTSFNYSAVQKICELNAECLDITDHRDITEDENFNLFS